MLNVLTPCSQAGSFPFLSIQRKYPGCRLSRVTQIVGGKKLQTPGWGGKAENVTLKVNMSTAKMSSGSTATKHTGKIISFHSGCYLVC